VGLFLARVVGFDGFALDHNIGVTFLPCLGTGGDGAGDVAGREPERNRQTRENGGGDGRYHLVNLLLSHNIYTFTHLHIFTSLSSPLQGGIEGGFFFPPLQGGIEGGEGLLAVVGFVVLVSADFPQISPHGLFAIRQILLREEVRLVLGDVRKVVLTHLDCRLNRAKSLTYSDFLL